MSFVSGYFIGLYLWYKLPYFLFHFIIDWLKTKLSWFLWSILVILMRWSLSKFQLTTWEKNTWYSWFNKGKNCRNYAITIAWMKLHTKNDTIEVHHSRKWCAWITMKLNHLLYMKFQRKIDVYALKACSKLASCSYTKLLNLKW